MPRQRPHGFTLVELVTVLAIVGLLTGVALPAFHDAVLHRQLRLAAEALRADLDRARLLAVATDAPVTVIAGDGRRGWAGGWTAWQHGRALKNLGHPALDTGLRTARRQAPSLHFDSLGAANPPQTITFCVRRKPATAIKVVVSIAGRVRTSTDDVQNAHDCAR
ncbi:MAG: hypothetical protein GAK28_00181 [Luteibacter sp.]|uniref:GspH/FimT family pseudopilin n=1 Tax=Luteibacter sp. TaxID=1886636 RepID=UPI001380A02D|nr:GspH/FimT family pseudopilin [Luteibacter sp.]KAF1009542.1 MAG: hypothetical protein GAK28_00181 [Luteibacter sp.]